MKILVVEDELKAARALIKLIISVKPDVQISGPVQSVRSAIAFLETNPVPDLIFMDIQLSDGLSFEIFGKIKVPAPVIFCTAFNEYALEAFKTNGIAYILKPFNGTDITAAFDKLDLLTKPTKNQNFAEAYLAKMIKASQETDGKKSFLVYKGTKYLTIDTSDIAYFFVHNEETRIVTFDNEWYPVDQSLDQTASQLPEKDFFRLNRQFLICFRAIKEVEHYFSRKLWVKLTVPVEEKLLVGKDKTSQFLHWLDER
ncbi:LytTR family DNA-binding domain-containing protein [Cytophagaceae bacterium YF14B1]|uniref:LytTR family DNA-binding domain-containing protein n=1 Tax=Xanthocytophaga flava TaxID=3048013 RepID=A0AAE3QYY0_9BACT|nr:LytTR family DNA-binding domain-containing protein [Xanthocytophaga flavus]MDJ1485063.1 LytTR family DNA-binding domain-containing protein [Xanthocytophaga flavus]